MRYARDGGFTLLELVIGLLLGTIIVSAAISFLITHVRSLEGGDIRENVARNDRYIGALLRHDLHMAGIGIESEELYATVGVYPGTYGDTLVLLHVPYDPGLAPIHHYDPTESRPPRGEGTCGIRCVEVLFDDSEPIELQPGDLARLQLGATRRLILITDVEDDGDELEIEFSAADTLLSQPAGLEGIRLNPFSTLLQKVSPIVYYVDDQERLLRAEQVNTDGSPRGHVVAYNVQEFDISVIFEDGDELPYPNPYDSDLTNDFNDMVTIKVRVTVKADRADPRVNHGELLTKTSLWRISPRNLRYEKNVDN
jgi:prepilin-type N-terminal cleavage/methylation domain-containing protein